MDDTAAIQKAFVKNRAEELGYDVWKHFAVPPFFDRLDLADARKPRVIVGGRGCGKTMLLRYLSHQSAFSTDRAPVPLESLQHIGLYWRADTQFAAAMNGRGIADDVWHSAFNHLLAVTNGLEVLASLRSIAGSHLNEIDKSAVFDVQFSELAPYFPSPPPSTIEDLQSHLETTRREFQMWVNNVHTSSIPRFLPGAPFLFDLIRLIKKAVPCLSNSTYFIYVDEYENLSTYQQRIVNTCLKHSESPLIFNLAMKRNAFVTRETLGNESIMEIADFRMHNLEDYLRQDFEVFAAEILFLNISSAKPTLVPFDVSLLRDPSRLGERRSDNHKRRVTDAAERLFPDVPQRQLAEMAFADSSIRGSLQDRISMALRDRGTTVKVEEVFDATYPEASIVVPALLHRKTLDPSVVAKEFASLRRGEVNKFTGPTDWVHNNFVGCLLHLYEPHSRTCPFYAGFRTFCLLARGNIRHLLELCHKAIARVETLGTTGGLKVPPLEQAEAARQASTDFLKEVRSFGKIGNQLHTFVLRLGSVLALAHSRPTQSEPEPSHFSIRPRVLQLETQDQDFIREAVKWSVLFEEEETKQKDHIAQANVEYVLNPIYAPYFRITYRKRRRLEFTAEEFVTLTRGTYDDVRSLLKRLTEQWLVDLESVNDTLFSHMKGTKEAKEAKEP
jgi:hypothetical protein